MGLKIEIEVKDKHTITVHEEGDLWLMADAGDEILNALEGIIDHYHSVFTKLKSEEYYGDHS
jgi:hypothetical protein